MFTTFFLLAFSVFWIGSGIFMCMRPNSALRRTQAPWTALSQWGMRAVGVLVLGGGGWLLYAGIAHIR